MVRLPTPLLKISILKTIKKLCDVNAARTKNQSNTYFITCPEICSPMDRPPLLFFRKKAAPFLWIILSHSIVKNLRLCIINGMGICCTMRSVICNRQSFVNYLAPDHGDCWSIAREIRAGYRWMRALTKALDQFDQIKSSVAHLAAIVTFNLAVLLSPWAGNAI